MRECRSGHVTLGALPDDAVHSRCVTPPVSLSPVRSSSIRCGSWSRQPRPPPKDIDHVDPELVHQPGREELLVDVRAHQPDPLRGGGLLGLGEGTLAIPSVTKVNTGSELAGGW